MEQRVDQRGESISCHHRAGYTGQWKVLCRGQLVHQATDRKRVFDVCL